MMDMPVLNKSIKNRDGNAVHSSDGFGYIQSIYTSYTNPDQKRPAMAGDWSDQNLVIKWALLLDIYA